MRTTLDIDDDVLESSRIYARAHKISVGKALSEMARRGASRPLGFTMRNGFPVFDLPEGTPGFGLEDVQAAEDADDAEYIRRWVLGQER